MRKNRLIALIGTLTMAAAGLAAVSAGVSKSNQEIIEASAAGWAEKHVYVAIDAATAGSYTVKINANRGGNTGGAQWDSWAMSKTDDTYHGKPVYYGSYWSYWGGLDELQIQLYDGGAQKASNSIFNSFKSDTDLDGKIIDYESKSISTFTADIDPSSTTITYYLYDVDSLGWTVHAHYWKDGNTVKGGTTWPGDDMTDLGNGLWSVEISESFDRVIFNNGLNGDQNKTKEHTLYVDTSTKRCFDLWNSYDGSVRNGQWNTNGAPYFVRYDITGATGTAPENVTARINQSSKPTAASGSGLSKSGFNFKGWTTTSGGLTVDYDVGATISSSTPGQVITLYPVWEQKAAEQYMVAFDNNGGSGSMTSITTNVGSTTAVPACTFTAPEGKKFKEWNSAQNGGGDTYDSTHPVPSQATGTTKTIYAIWEEFNPHNGYWVEFYGDKTGTRVALDHNESENQWEKLVSLEAGDIFKIVNYSAESIIGSYGIDQARDKTAMTYGQIVAEEPNTYQNFKVVYDGDYQFYFHDTYDTYKTDIKPITYQVTYHANNDKSESDFVIHPNVGHNFTTAKIGTGEADANFTAPSVDKVFKGWNTKADGSGTSHNTNESNPGLAQNQNLDLYAMWGDPVADGMYLRGSFDWTAQGQVHMDADSTVENQFVAKGIKLEDGHSVKAVGYSNNYESWIDATSAGVPTGTGYSASVDNTNAKITENRGVFNVYVKTSDGSYNFYPLRVTYDANNGSGDAMSPSFPTGEGYLATVSENTYTAPSENMRFNGWNTAADGSGTSYNANSTIDFSPRTEDLTLYAQWLGQVTLTYTDDQGTRTFTGYPGDAFVAPAARDKVGYTTVGWSNTYTTYPNQNTTVTAVYDAINYAISFNAGDGASGGSVSPSTYNISDTAQTVTITPPSKEGATPSYTIVGDDYVGTVPTISGTTVTIPAGSYGDFSVITTWTPITPTVTIEIEGNGYVVDDEGNEVETLTVEYGDEFIFDNENGEALIGDYTIYAIGGDSTQQYNYVFKEWSIDPACESITGNVTITATFEPELRTYSLSYGGSGYTKPTSPAEGSHEYGTEIQNAPVATKEHYTLKGWYTDASLTHEVTFPYTITNDVTLYPKFEIEKETITITINGNYGVVKDDNGNVVTSIDVPYGTYVGLEDDNSITLLADDFEAYLYPVANKAGDEYKYSFTSWTGITDGEEITGNKTIYANFSQQKQTYTITFYDEDCETLLDTQIVEYGETPVYGGIIPTKESSVSKNYTFDGWTENLAPVTGDKSYFAKYAESPREYTITWKNGDTSLGTTSVAYGQTPVYTGETPTKEGTEDYTYTFTGWTPEITSVTGEATYTAAFRQDLTDLGIAKDYASRFVEDLHKDGLCAITEYDEKGNPIYNPDMEELQKFWDKYSKEFNALSTAAENYLKSATPDSSEEASVLNSFAWSYQYVYTKYGKNFADFGGDFLKKGYTPNSSRLVSVSDISTSTWIIAAVAVVGIAAVGVFFIYKKRKEI